MGFSIDLTMFQLKFHFAFFLNVPVFTKSYDSCPVRWNQFKTGDNGESVAFQLLTASLVFQTNYSSQYACT